MALVTAARWGISEFTPAAGTRMHAAVSGTAGAPEVVCVHGLGCSHRYFGPLAGRLAPDARVSAPDLPGFGRSRGPATALDVRGLSVALADWLRATGRAGAALVANSTGCQVVVDLAVHSPELVGPIVLNGPTMDRHARSALRQISRLLRDAAFERPTLGLVLARDYVDCGPRRFLTTFARKLEDPIERKLPLVQAPAIVVRGSRDPIVPHGWAAEVSRLLPDARLVEVPGAGHTLNYSAAAPLAELALELVAGPGVRP